MGTIKSESKSSNDPVAGINPKEPLEVKDCALITRMAGIETAINLRELRERIRVCPPESLFHHFCETAVRPGFDDPEFHNDFAVWTARLLRDRVLAERLGIINPYLFKELEDVRQHVIDIIDEHLADLPNIPWVKKGDDFRFMRALTVVFDTDMKLEEPNHLIDAIRKMTLSSLYYHYVDARRRNHDKIDDFSIWLEGFRPESDVLISALADLDFYFMNLPELQKHLISSLEKVTKGNK